MTVRQLVNRNSYVVASVLVLLVAAYFVGRVDNLAGWLIWILAAVLLYAGFFALRPGRGSQLSDAELERLVGSGTALFLQLFSNY